MEIEVELQRRWSLAEGAAPPGLRAYRAKWLQFLQSAPLSDLPELWDGLEPPSLVVVGDFHSLPRSARSFAALVRTTPWKQAPRIVLELLPAAESSRKTSLSALRLTDGRPLSEAMPDLVELCKERDLEVCGTWFSESPEMRDQLAAEAWTRRQKLNPSTPEAWLFGDWHLAEPHLPSQLRAKGARPTLVHQSPAPLWQRGARLRRETYLDLGNGHRAWLHTPPLAYLSSSAAEACVDAASDQEAAELLVEALANGLWSGLELRGSAPTFEAVSELDWAGFWRSLPEEWRAHYESHRSPDTPLLHPLEPRAFMPQTASWNDVAGVAAGLLVQHARPGQAFDAAGFAFRSLCQRSWNPFLRPIPKQLPVRIRDSKLAQAMQQGAQVAAVLAQSGQATVAEAQQLLCRGMRSLIWHHVMSTIQAESATA